MKQQTIRLVTAFAVAGGLALAGSALAQPVTGTPTLSNLNPVNLTLGGSWSTPTTTLGPTGVEESSINFGYLHYDIPLADQQVLNPLDTLAAMTFTINSPTPDNWTWFGCRFILDDSVGGAGADNWYAGYNGYNNPGSQDNIAWNGNVVTITCPLVGTTLQAAQTGGSIISFNLLLDPAVISGGFYDLTYNSLVMEPAPEPATLALVGLGAFSLLALRRRK